MKPQDLKQQRILFGCLNWGSGHVARSIGLIRKLSSNGNTIFLICDTQQRSVFERYDLAVTFIDETGFSFRFKGDGNFVLEMVRNARLFRKAIALDHQRTDALVQELRIDTVISDHRYGLYAATVPSIFVTHQVQLPPKAGFFAQYIHKKWMKRFSEIWIMDTEESRLAGILSSPVSNATFIGWYSRFEGMEITSVPGKTVAIISGPEPYAEHLYDEVMKRVSGFSELIIVSRKAYGELPSNCKLVSNWLEADHEIASAEKIISRNGYSTLMDLQFLKKEAILLPTPGQLEQEYLATLRKDERTSKY